MERISDKGISSFQKRTNIAINDEAVDYWHSRGGIVVGSFIILPTDQEDDFKRLEDYIRTREIDVPLLCILTPLPGTEIWEQYRDELDPTFSKFDHMHLVIPSTLPRAEFYKHYRHLFTSLNTRRLVWRMIKSVGVGTWLLRLPRAYGALRSLRGDDAYSMKEA